ncbi:MAG: MFS transporter [Caulobacter sp.]|nr:MFS transporter [Caulobacter sp.]
MTIETAAPRRLSNWRLAAFATPCVPLAAMLMPVTAYLPNYYATDLGVSFVELAWAFMMVRFFDLWFDPAFGLIMDRTRTRWGRFRPWFVAGAPIAMVAVYMLFMARPGIGGSYILLWLVVGFVGQSMAQLGHMAWASAVAPGYDDRSRIFGWWQALSVIGMISILLLPPLVKFVFRADFATGIRAMGWFAIISLPLTAALALLTLPEPPVRPPARHATMADVLALARRGSVLRVLAADICWGTALSISGTLLFFFFDAVRGIERGMAGLMLIVYFLGALVGAPIWTRLARRVGKYRALMVGGCVWAVMQLSVLIAPNNLAFGFATMALAGLPFAAGPILLKAMMGDVGDEERLASGVDRTGLLFSLLTGSIKIGSMLAVGGSQFALDAIGFDAKLGGGNSPGALTVLAAMFTLGPAALALTAVWAISGYRLDAAAHAGIRRDLDARDAA